MADRRMRVLAEQFQHALSRFSQRWIALGVGGDFRIHSRVHLSADS